MPRRLTPFVTALAVFFATTGTLSEQTSAEHCEGEVIKRPETVITDCWHGPTPVPPGQEPDNPSPPTEPVNGDGDDSNCEWVYVWTFDPEAPNADPTANLSGRRQHFFEIYCDGRYVGYEWVDAVDDGPPAPTPDDLIPGVWVSVQRRVPTPIPRIAPADTDPDGYAFVQTKTFFWVDQAPGQWAPVSGTASAPGLSVSVEAVPQQLVVTTGDGATVTCDGPPPTFPEGADPETFDGCGHIYTDSSAMAPNGETFPVTVSIVWHGSWSASNGESGDLGTLTTTSPPRDLPVAEIQAVVVQG